ncbi:hypothetical protein [Caudoviricetes sp.]|nr:hypothetical protein [Caudoviricetes sp.]UOF81379.1 hypothetical protein [Caudoviricetes sp.]
MTEHDELLIESLDKLILQAEVLKKLKDTQEWEVLRKILVSLRTSALEDVLAGGEKNDSIHAKIGYARAVNAILNSLDSLILTGKISAEDRQQHLSRISQEEKEQARQDESVRSYGGAGMIS